MNDLENEIITKFSAMFGISSSQGFLMKPLKDLFDILKLGHGIKNEDMVEIIKNLISAMTLTQVLSKLSMIPVAGPVINSVYQGIVISSSTGAILGVLYNFLKELEIPDNILEKIKDLQVIAENNPPVEIYNRLMMLYQSGDINKVITSLKDEFMRLNPIPSICFSKIEEDLNSKINLLQVPQLTESPQIPQIEKSRKESDLTQIHRGGSMRTIKNKKNVIRNTLNTINNTILTYLKRTSRRFQPFRKTIASRKVKRSF
jgi:uncharacterized protein (DUF697 family)